jgi:2-polyprenyl-3-methyl-5-hydroxy-6-metoxy-1,4-benzoquinol methylase
MPIRVDPEGNEILALFSQVDLGGQQVLEIGSGDGRLTWRFAGKAAHVTAIEPFAASVEKAKQNLPHELKGIVEFNQIGFDEFARSARSGAYDCVILSWALC